MSGRAPNNLAPPEAGHSLVLAACPPARSARLPPMVITIRFPQAHQLCRRLQAGPTHFSVAFPRQTHVQTLCVGGARMRTVASAHLAGTCVCGCSEWASELHQHGGHAVECTKPVLVDKCKMCSSRGQTTAFSTACDIWQKGQHNFRSRHAGSWYRRTRHESLHILYSARKATAAAEPSPSTSLLMTRTCGMCVEFLVY